MRRIAASTRDRSSKHDTSHHVAPRGATLRAWAPSSRRRQHACKGTPWRISTHSYPLQIIVGAHSVTNVCGAALVQVATSTEVNRGGVGSGGGSSLTLNELVNSLTVNELLCHQLRDTVRHRQAFPLQVRGWRRRHVGGTQHGRRSATRESCELGAGLSRLCLVALAESANGAKPECLKCLPRSRTSAETVESPRAKACSHLWPRRCHRGCLSLDGCASRSPRLACFTYCEIPVLSG